MFRANPIRFHSFWWFQTAGYCCLLSLSILVVLPYVRHPGELGYQDLIDLLSDQVLLCLGVFFASLTLRPVCRSLMQRRLSWISMEVQAAGWSLVIGAGAIFAASRFIVAKPEAVELLEACTKTSVLLLLWCNLYFSIKQTQQHAQEQEQLARVEEGALDHTIGKYASRFTVRTGSRIQVLLAQDLQWIAAAGDYTELHTRDSSHLLRETMNSLEQKLDPSRFARIHRSRIVSLAHILELQAIDNREYVVKLSDGSCHRCSRTYADRIDRWLRTQH
jgi:DNA-binding LytR/AlgR family response regulator